MRCLIVSLLLLSLTCLSQNIFGDSYRCGRKLVKTGDSSRDLLKICGEPLHKDRGSERVRVKGVVRETRVERWYYKKNRRSVERVVLLHGGKIVAIEMGSR